MGIAERFRCVDAEFTRVVAAVEGDAWSEQSPCAGWTALDVVEHLVTWLPGPGFLLGTYGVETGPIPPNDREPLAAWEAVSHAIQTALDDPVTSQRVEDCGPLGAQSFADAVELTCISDVLVHTWDLGQAVGVDVVLDPSEVARQLERIAATPPAVDAAMRASGHFGPRVAVGDDTDAVTRLLAFYGRPASTRSPGDERQTPENGDADDLNQ
jgi:uncharacterized protein (TIGR03086 family)